MNMIQAINSAMDVMMGRDPNVIVMGEDVGYFGGVFRATAGLQAKYGKTRAFDTPITEMRHHRRRDRHGRLWPAPGPRDPVRRLYLSGARPARLRSGAAALSFGGDFIAPITVRSPFGGGIFGGQTHSQSPEGIFTHVSGMKTVIPVDAL
jgi:2-oxoisovalerate dehydrogenase E1 component beta subunit